MDLLQFLTETQSRLTSTTDGQTVPKRSNNLASNEQQLRPKLIESLITIEKTSNVLKKSPKKSNSCLDEEVTKRRNTINDMSNQLKTVLDGHRRADRRRRRLHQTVNQYLSDAQKDGLMAARDVQYYQQLRDDMKSRVTDRAKHLHRLYTLDNKITQLSQSVKPLSDNRNSLLATNQTIKRNIKCLLSLKKDYKTKAKANASNH